MTTSIETCAHSRRVQWTFSRIWNINERAGRVKRKIKRFTLFALDSCIGRDLFYLELKRYQRQVQVGGERERRRASIG